MPVREPLKTWRFRGALNRRRDAINHASFFFDLPRLKDSRCFLLSARAERAYNEGALHSLPFFLCVLPSSNFHFPGETTRLSPPPILPSRSLLVRRCVVFIFPSRPSLFYSQFSSLPFDTLPFYRSLLHGRRSYVRNRFVCTRARRAPLCSV